MLQEFWVISSSEFGYLCLDDDGAWFNRLSYAMRFARKLDAQRVIDWTLGGSPNFQATHHIMNVLTAESHAKEIDTVWVIAKHEMLQNHILPVGIKFEYLVCLNNDSYMGTIYDGMLNAVQFSREQDAESFRLWYLPRFNLTVIPKDTRSR